MTILLNEQQIRFLRSMDDAGVQYLVIGGWALRAHGVDRRTHDLDVWVSRSGDNPERILTVLRGMCGPGADRFLGPLHEPLKRLAMPDSANPEIDILTSIGDLDFDAVYAASHMATVGTMLIRVPNAADLLRTKLVAIASIQERINSGEWDGNDLVQAELQKAKDQVDIDLMQHKLHDSTPR
ncbi:MULTISPECIES: hypothetical protein [unclassified Cupriavidus]|uniref:hypothetical protein n=1 Tax=unclassified Cupriavidus TaxID=2640874 RepID=UPI00313D50CB